MASVNIVTSNQPYMNSPIYDNCTVYQAIMLDNSVSDFEVVAGSADTYIYIPKMIIANGVTEGYLSIKTDGSEIMRVAMGIDESLVLDLLPFPIRSNYGLNIELSKSVGNMDIYATLYMLRSP